ncbi:MAG: bifunctional proline dehydrogenase/L-glutamate gamma-semialdehyde dehydrogenase PutA [Gammaproteobacteria bacterium]|nr:bifunctional proline dehydrogenase/L-glutamate gamma-semialdehyde dehydrogenase PutA [Gammaproteobacteria bacterium]
MIIKEQVIPQLDTDDLRQKIRANYLQDETTVLQNLVTQAGFSDTLCSEISLQAINLIKMVRQSSVPSIMENFLAEYGLTSKEGVALMCLAEALLRVPDSQTIDELIEDKISHGNWGQHLGHSDSPLVNASTWALLITGKVIAPEDEKSMRYTLQGLVKRLGEPLVRTAVAQSMKELGRHFVLGTTINKAMRRATELEARGYAYSYDMLGEAARTDADARRYHLAYSDAISALAAACRHDDIRQNPGISVKLSALHPRYEIAQQQGLIDQLVARCGSLAMLACSANMGFNIDAEEADRLDISLEVIEQVLSNPALKNWDGFGVVVQAFGRRASQVLDWLYQLANRLDRKIMVRLVKGAYWDTEIKRAQVLGLMDYPVFTRKLNTDISYLACSKQLLGMVDRIYPQFATHNAHSVAAVRKLASQLGQGLDTFEFQRLHGMGEALYDFVVREKQARCRIYAPVGEHEDLLAYLVRRLLENGANSSFVNQIVDTSIVPEEIARDPFGQLRALAGNIANPCIKPPPQIYGEERRNSRGWDITDIDEIQYIDEKRKKFSNYQWQAGTVGSGQEVVKIFNPADTSDEVGQVYQANSEQLEQTIARSQTGFLAWSTTPVKQRSDCLRRVADLYEANAEELFALLSREAGKNWLDAVGEVREAVDFALYYAGQAEALDDQGEARGAIVCISPWNFPLAIFSGQIFAAIAAGNTVLAKPAEQTSLIAARAVALMYEAGIPASVVQLLPGPGTVIGEALTSDPRIVGVCFTGSTITAQRINRNMARHLDPTAPLIAETGGLNAMIVDSTALPEQVVRDVLASAFQSAGQRCSALRMLYLQQDIADKLLTMLFGAMDELVVGNPWLLNCDVGPVIDTVAKTRIEQHCQKMADQGRLMKQIPVPAAGLYVAPTVIKLDGIEQLEEEIFGPVLHVATFEAREIDEIVDTVNARGYGLTFGLHTRVDTRVEQVVKRIKTGNIYVNRNQIGAVVGTQPFGGEGLSGTGPKAGGPSYLKRFRSFAGYHAEVESGDKLDADVVQAAIQQCLGLPRQSNPQAVEREVENMPGPTGESNQLSTHPRGLLLCLGPSRDLALQQATAALSLGNRVVVIAAHELVELHESTSPVVTLQGLLTAGDLSELNGFDAILYQANDLTAREYRLALANREGALIPLIDEVQTERLVIERHLCVDTTAAGGNASLIAASS